MSTLTPTVQTEETGIDRQEDLQALHSRAMRAFEELREIEEGVESTKQAGRAENTRRSYQAAWDSFTQFCDRYNMPTAPATPQAVVYWMEQMRAEGYAYGTISTRVAGLSVGQDRIIREITEGERPVPDHVNGELINPCRTTPVRDYKKALRRQMDTQPDQKEPVLFEHVQTMERKGLFTGTKGIRDRAVLLVGLASAFRRSELASLNISDVDSSPPHGIEILLRKSKTDQEGKGERIFIPDDMPAFDVPPTEALNRWMRELDENTGPLFRSVDRWRNIRDNRISGQTVHNIVTDYMEEIGEPPARYGAHSLRAGLITEARSSGIDEGTVAAHSRHKDMDTFREYVRPSMEQDNHFLSRIGQRENGRHE